MVKVCLVLVMFFSLIIFLLSFWIVVDLFRFLSVLIVISIMLGIFGRVVVLILNCFVMFIFYVV